MKDEEEKKMRVAIVGCGAVTERLHIPALARLKDCKLCALVDQDKRRISFLASNLDNVHKGTSIEHIEQYADVGIVAVPHYLHASIAISLIERGLHVFIEKPIATTVEEAKKIINAARSNNRSVCVGQIRRYYECFEVVQKILNAGLLGKILSFDFREGGLFNWPIASVAPFSNDKGGGVLLDTGAHTLDMVFNWLGNFESVQYRDDRRGGVEANVYMDIYLCNGARGVVELSRTRNLRNTFSINGENGVIEGRFGYMDSVTLKFEDKKFYSRPFNDKIEKLDFIEIGKRQLESFIKSIQEKTEPIVNAESVMESIRLFDECHKKRNAMSLEWQNFEGEVDWTSLGEGRMLIIGASGFLGGRLIQVLGDNSKLKLRVLVRDLSKLSNIARYPIEIVHGDITSSESLEQAIKGCRYVINCTYGKGDRQQQRSVNIDAVRKLVQLAARNNIKSVIHISTVSVYGIVNSGKIDEDSEYRANRKDIYGYTKMIGEQVAIKEAQRFGVPLVVIQPTIIYGPDAPIWTINQLNIMRANKFVLPYKGSGICNAVYVDDVVTAILRAAVTPDAFGKRFLINGPDMVTWLDFYREYEKMLGNENIIAMNEEQLAIARKKQKKEKSTLNQLRQIITKEYGGQPSLIYLPPLVALRKGVKAIIPRQFIEKMKIRISHSPESIEVQSKETLPMYIPPSAQFPVFKSKMFVSSEKATNAFGYVAKYRLTDGMMRLASWANWANLI